MPAVSSPLLASGSNVPSGEKDPYAWADHMDWMEGLEPPSLATKSASRWPGVIVAAAITFISMWLSGAPFWPFTLPGGMHPLDAALLAMLLGMLLGNFRPGWVVLQPGMRYGAKTLLALGIVLLGARLDFAELLRVGGRGVAVSAICVAGTLFLACRVVAPLFKIDRGFGFLIGVGTAICGGSAIVAVAPVVKAKEEQVVLGVACVTLVGLAAMLILPLIGAAAHLTEIEYGVWAGLAIHQVPQVITAGFAFGPTAGEFATVIKLARVCLLAPVVVCASIWMAHRSNGTSRFSAKMLARSVPLFVVGFALMAAARSLGLLPDIQFSWPTIFGPHKANADVSLQETAVACAGFFLALGMAGVGWETRFAALWKAGIRPLTITVTVSLLMAAAALWASITFFKP